VEDVWKIANGLNSRKSLDDILKRRGDHGVRIADLNYRKAGLELGMLKGNAFVITLRQETTFIDIYHPLRLSLSSAMFKSTP
jgi:tRNA(Glu) U13 pseudouridine synthase TruD